jgi:hypothetical protein
MSGPLRRRSGSVEFTTSALDAYGLRDHMPARLRGACLKLTINAINDAYEGTISADANSIAGIWQVQGKSQALKVWRATKKSAWLAAPTPYHVEFIEVEAGVKLGVG